MDSRFASWWRKASTKSVSTIVKVAVDQRLITAGPGSDMFDAHTVEATVGHFLSGGVENPHLRGL